MRQCACATLALFLLCFLPGGAESIVGKVDVKSKPRKAVRANQGRVLRTAPSKRDYPDETTRPADARDEALAVVLSVENPPKKGAPRGGVMRQKNKMFVPYVLPVTAGSEVKFPNDDNIYHGVYSDSDAKPFELPQYANGESRSVTFTKPGVVELFCHIHAHMNAYIVVLTSSYFAQPDKNHAYSIDNLPPGKYKVRAWHPRLGSKVQMVEVKKGQKATADFTL